MSKKRRSRKPSGSQNNAEAVSENKEQLAVKDSEAEGKDDFAQAVSTLADATGIISVIPPKENEDKKENVKEEPKNEKTKDKSSKKHDKQELDDQFKEMIDDALDENVKNLGILDDNSSQSSGISLSQILTTLFGLFVIGFAVFGIVSAGFKIHSYVEYKNSNIERIEYFERLVLPLSACDAPTFENVSVLNNDVIISAACWDVILSPSTSYVPENGSYKISYLDIDTRINKLFGRGLTYTHTTVGDEELMFVYDEDTGMYSIPTTPRTLAYFACVDELVPDENGYILTVSYKTPLTNWISTNTSADKIMTYHVVGNGLTYNIASLEIKEISNANGL